MNLGNAHVVHWCSLCNMRVSDGILTVEDPMVDEPVRLQACQPCVDKLNMPQQLEFTF